MNSDANSVSAGCIQYLDFDLEIGEGRGREYPVAVNSPAGEAHKMMRFPFDDLELDNRLKDLQIALLRSGGTRRLVLSREELAVQDFGEALFDALFAGDVRNLYGVSQERAYQEGKGLRLKLRIQPPKLAALPWEFLYDQREGEYLCLSRSTPVVRYLPLQRPIRPLTVTTPLRILGMITSPKGSPDLDVEREKQRVEKALKGLQRDGLVELTWLEGETWRHLQRAMRNGPWHVFHFIGHGGFDRNADQGFIALADEAGETQRLTAPQLGRLLANHRSVRLALLNSCEGARGGAQDIFSSSAASLVRRGIPAVLAMQYEITDRAAIELARTFYEALADGMPVDAAVVEARAAISVSVTNTVEWGTPVLYLRTPDGVLFRIQKRELARPILRFPSGMQVRSVPEWVDHVEQNERNWLEGRGLLYDGSLEDWLTRLNEQGLAREAECIRLRVTGDHSVGLEQFQRIAGSFEPHGKSDADTNINNLIGELSFLKLRKLKKRKTLIMEIKNRGRGYLHGKVISKVDWVEIPQPRFGCLPTQAARVEVLVDPTKRRTWELTLVPLTFILE